MIAGKVMGDYINGDGKKVYRITDIFQKKHELTYAEVLKGLKDKTIRLNNMEIGNDGKLVYKEEETSDYVKQGLEELRKAMDTEQDTTQQSQIPNDNIFAEVYGDLFDVMQLGDNNEKGTPDDRPGLNSNEQPGNIFESNVYEESTGTIKKDTLAKNEILKSCKNIKFKTTNKIDELKEKCNKAGTKFVDLGRNIFAAYGANDIIIVSSDKLKVKDGTELFKGAKLNTLDLTGIDFSDCIQADEMLECSQIDTLIMNNIQLLHMRSAKGFMYNATIKNISMKGFNAPALKNSYEMFCCLKTNKLDLSDSKFTSLTSLEKMFWGAKIIDLNIGKLTDNAVVVPLAFAASTIKNLKVDGLTVDITGSDTAFLLSHIIKPDIHSKELMDSFRNKGKSLNLGVNNTKN